MPIETPKQSEISSAATTSVSVCGMMRLRSFQIGSFTRSGVPNLSVAASFTQ
jgi:hypothetical protein